MSNIFASAMIEGEQPIKDQCLLFGEVDIGSVQKLMLHFRAQDFGLVLFLGKRKNPFAAVNLNRI